METDTSTTNSLIGTTLDNRYSITSLIGQGGMSTVYKAKHLFLNREVAIKIMQEHLSGNKEGKLRFQREAEAVGKLNHPNIVAISDFGVSENSEPYMVMDYLHGRSLADYIKEKGRPSPSLALSIFKQVASALQHAHEKGVLHRDLKPSNVMLVRGGSDNTIVAKVVDFGLARFLPSHLPTATGDSGETPTLNRRLTAAGELVGSPFYMSPEQIRDEELDARSDVYSLGCLLYEVLTGVRPFIDTNAITVLSMHLYESAPPFGLVLQPNRIPPRLESIVMKCLEKSRSNRYQTMRDLTAQLETMPEWEDGPSRSIPYDPTETRRPASNLENTGNISLDGSQTSNMAAAQYTLKLTKPEFVKHRWLWWLKRMAGPLVRLAEPQVKRFLESFEGRGTKARRLKVSSTRVLIAALGDTKEMIAAADEDYTKYAVYYKNVERRRSMNAQEFLVLLSTDKFDVIHLHGTFDKRATFKDSTGFHLRFSDVKRACDYSQVKLLWLASANHLQWLKDNPVLDNPSFHLILTSDRGKNFPKFLSSLLSRVARGEPVVSAWESYVPHAEYKGEKTMCRLVPGPADTAFLP